MAARLAGPRTPVRHVTLPFALTAQADPLPGERIAEFLARTGWSTNRLPTICVVNGAPVLRRYWKRRRIKLVDKVEFWSRPWGGAAGSGGGKQILGIVALIALAAFAPWAAGLAFGAGTLMAGVAAAAITIGGGLLIASLTKPAAGGTNATDSSKDQVEQLYSAAAQGNTARLLQPLTVQYGRDKSFPDFATTPFSEYDGNDQYLNVLLATGLGSYEYEALYIDDTVLWTPGGGYAAAFTDVEHAFYEPNADVTLFPTNVVQSDEVSGQDITTTPVGGFVANAAGTDANAVAVDLVFPNGCFSVNTTTNNLSDSSVTILVEAREVDGAGAPVGGWFQLSSTTYTMATRNPQRRSIKDTIEPAGRYEVRVSRTDAGYGSGGSGTQTPNTEEINGVVWAGLRAFIEGPSSFPVSTVAIRIKANSQLTSASARKFGVLCTRKLYVWDTDTDTFVLEATRNPFWAAYDAATDTTYGAARPPSKIDFQSVFDMAFDADTRGDTFDYRFTSAVAVPEALDTILRVARARHRWSGDVLTFVRDEWPAGGVPRMLLTDREIIRGSLSLEYALNPDDAADAVIVEYKDEDIWNAAELQYPQNSGEFTAVAPSRIRLPGVVNREHAHREAAFYYLQSQLRRVTATLDTEHDGRMLGFGSRVRVQTELPLSWGASGYVVSRSTNTLVVSPAPTWPASGPYYIAIRTKTGRQFGPVLCTQGASTAHVVLNVSDLAAVETAQSTTLTATLVRQDGAEDPSFDFGAGTARARDCIVLTGRPSKERVTLSLVVDDFAVHSTDLSEAPVRPQLPSLVDARTPIIQGLYATFRQGVAEPILDASWVPATGAQFYRARISSDSGESWTNLPETIAPQLSQVVPRAALRLQVAGVGVRHGPWTQVDLDAPVILIGDDTVGVRSLIAGLSDRVTNILKAVQAKNDEIEQFIATHSIEQDAHNAIDKVRTKARDAAMRVIIADAVGDIEGITASVALLETAVADADEAFAAFVLEVETNYATNTSVATAKSEAIATATSNAASALATYSTTASATFATQVAMAAADASTLSAANAFATGAVSTLSTSVTASFAATNANVTTVSNAVATINGIAAASYAVTLNVNGHASGFKLLSDGTTGNSVWAVDNFSIATSGHSPQTVFNVGTVSGSAAVTIKGTLIADGAAVFRVIAAGSVDATRIAVNGVDILNIIDEAVSSETYFNTSSVTNSQSDGVLLGSGSITLKSGRTTTLTFVSNMNNDSGDLGITTPGLGFISFDVRVDGSTHQNVEYPYGYYVKANKHIWRGPVSFTVPITGLSTGSHTFAVYLNANSGAGFVNLSTGRISVRQVHR